MEKLIKIAITGNESNLLISVNESTVGIPRKQQNYSETTLLTWQINELVWEMSQQPKRAEPTMSRTDQVRRCHQAIIARLHCGHHPSNDQSL